MLDIFVTVNEVYKKNFNFYKRKTTNFLFTEKDLKY